MKWKTVVSVLGVVLCRWADATEIKVESESFSGIDSMAEIRKTVDAVAVKGGGTVCLPASDYVVSSVFLKDKVTLHLERGATLVVSINFLDYAFCPSSVKGLDHAVANAYGARNVALSLFPTFRKFDIPIVFQSENAIITLPCFSWCVMSR